MQPLLPSCHVQTPLLTAALTGLAGSMQANEVSLSMRDGARVVNTHASATTLRITAGQHGAHFMLLEMQKA